MKIKDHKNLRTIKLDVADAALGPDFQDLRRLLSQNKRIQVTNFDDKVYSDGASIDELYSLNRFYCGSAFLVLVPSPERP